jgi:outer membrane protein assembly factor BamB
LVLVTAGYRVIALQKSDGRQIRETALVTSFFKPMCPFITLVMDDAGVYASTNNEIFRLELSTGAILWRSELDSGQWVKSQAIASIALSGMNSGSSSNQATKMKLDQSRTSGT